CSRVIALTAPCSARSRTSPTKLASPPIPVLPSVRRASSTPISKSSRWTRIIASHSAAGHRRGQGDLLIRPDRMVVLDILVVDRHLDHVAPVESGGILRTEGCQPIQQPVDALDMIGRDQLFLGLADIGPDPCKIQQLHLTSLGALSPHIVTN